MLPNYFAINNVTYILFIYICSSQQRKVRVSGRCIIRNNSEYVFPGFSEYFMFFISRINLKIKIHFY